MVVRTYYRTTRDLTQEHLTAKPMDRAPMIHKSNFNQSTILYYLLPLFLLDIYLISDTVELSAAHGFLIEPQKKYYKHLLHYKLLDQRFKMTEV